MGVAKVEIGGPYPRTGYIYVMGLILNGACPYWPLFSYGGAHH